MAVFLPRKFSLVHKRPQKVQLFGPIIGMHSLINEVNNRNVNNQRKTEICNLI